MGEVEVGSSLKQCQQQKGVAVCISWKESL